MNIMSGQTANISAPAKQESSKPVQQAPQPVAPPPAQEPQRPITVQPVQFASFDDAHDIYGESNKNLNILMDIKLTLTVELGRTELPIKKVLELTRGSVIELDKIAGEPVELYANGKLVAKGEVVVIEDNFGLRITNIVSPENRLKTI
jgi:flagellar motor switch protein FliN/FliY